MYPVISVFYLFNNIRSSKFNIIIITINFYIYDIRSPVINFFFSIFASKNKQTNGKFKKSTDLILIYIFIYLPEKKFTI